MMISRSNYEIYFVDYFDGQLDEEAKRELFDFLQANPDLKAEFRQFEQTNAEPDSNIVFGNKESLKKNTPTVLNYKTWLVAEFEGDLSNDEITQLDEFIRKNPSLEEERMKMQEVRLVAESVSFTTKSKLKKPVVVPFRITTRVASIAAAVAIFILGYLFIFRPKEEKIFVDDKKEKAAPQNTPSIAEQNSSTEKQVVHPNPDVQSVDNKDMKHQKLPNKYNRKTIRENKNDKQLFTQSKPVNPVEEKKIDTLKVPSPSISPSDNDQPEMAQKKTGTRRSNPVDLTDVFNEQDLKDMTANASKDATPVESVALKEFERISGVSVRTDKSETTKTYALQVKKVFSITHTSVNR